MTKNDMREAFERGTQWEGDCAKYADGDYVNEVQQHQWDGFQDGWQASRQRIIDKLNSPEMVEAIAKRIIICRDGKEDGQRRFRDKKIRDAYIGDAFAAIAAVLEGM